MSHHDNVDDYVVIDGAFLKHHLVTGLSVFVAPLVALGAAFALTTRPSVNTKRAVARMRHVSRLTKPHSGQRPRSHPIG